VLKKIKNKERERRKKKLEGKWRGENEEWTKKREKNKIWELEYCHPIYKHHYPCFIIILYYNVFLKSNQTYPNRIALNSRAKHFRFSPVLDKNKQPNQNYTFLIF